MTHPMKLLAKFAASCAALGLLALLFLVALVEVVFRGGKALDCGMEDEQ